MKQLARLLRFLAPYTPAAIAAVLLLAFVGLSDAFRILLVRPIFDKVLSPGSPGRDIVLINIPHTSLALHLQQLVPGFLHNAWTMVAFALIGSALLKSLADYTGTYLINYAGFGMITDLRNSLYEAVLRRSTSFFHRHTTGTLLSTLINDIERVQMAMSTVLSDFLQQVFTLLFTAGVVIVVGGKLAWVLLIFVPVIALSARRVGRKVRDTTRRGQDRLAEIQNILHETITGNRIVKAFSMEAWETTRFRKAARTLFRANLRSVRAQAVSSPLMDFIGIIAIALLLLIGRQRINTGAMTIGSFLTFIIAVFKMYEPVRKFAGFYNSFQQAVGASSSIFEFLDVKDDVQEKPRAIALKGFHDNICFTDVVFSYRDDEGEKRVLDDLSLTVKCGEVLALVGPSGAGKSTLTQLIPRFFDVTGGRIEVDGHDVRDVSVHSLRGLIAKVTQETILFNDTVRNNIAYGRPDISAADVESAARAALAHDFILQMPEGYDTVIGERGFRLSGGERQRLAIARAILKNAPILILDEATSALDTESESLVQIALSNLMSGRTVVVVAHRLSTVRRADRIVVLERGRITESGTHDELITNSGTYQRLYELQFASAEEMLAGSVN